jgi:hypothetical protein
MPMSSVLLSLGRFSSIPKPLLLKLTLALALILPFAFRFSGATRPKTSLRSSGRSCSLFFFADIQQP